MLPGLCGDGAVAAFKLFLGTQPTVAVEQRLLRNVQTVYPWFASRKRVKEAANDFMEVDLASVDSELLQRYSHTFYVRRQMFDESLDKQLALLESGKPPKAADVAVSQALAEIHATAQRAIEQEFSALAQLKPQCNVAGRRELDPAAPFHPFDTLCMMRVAEEDTAQAKYGLTEVESRAREFFPAERVHETAAQLAQGLLGDEAKLQLDKKDARLWTRMHPSDYNKVGCISKYRPIDVAAYYRFFGERAVKSQDPFTRALWGNVFRKFASNARYLTSISRYWSLQSGLDNNPIEVNLPTNIANAIEDTSSLFPGVSFRTLYFYSSAETARQLWRVDPFVPLMRLFPLMGQSCAEEALAFLLVENVWSQIVTDNSVNVSEETITRELKSFVEDAAALRSHNVEKLLTQVTDAGVRVMRERQPVASEEESETVKSDQKAD